MGLVLWIVLTQFILLVLLCKIKKNIENKLSSWKFVDLNSNLIYLFKTLEFSLKKYN